ncbi:GNAT family N-acetyltransferase [Fluviicola sp.]|uniref:GNAT family N-acetyltransferase n=1 Tax=Fluviicola sp. TaxID=1917219 RepID=UPI003D29B2C1
MEPEFILIAYGSEGWKSAVQLREEILRKPLGSFFTAEELEEERKHLHIVGFLGDELIATAVLVPEGDAMKMQRVVVKEGNQDSGIGSKMMSFCEKIANENKTQRIYCHARDTAVNFYLKNNYLAEGEYFPEDGIPHLMMYKSITE